MIGLALGTYAAWTLLTWLLEGRIRTLLRPDATLDRLVYTLVANVLVGTVLALVVAGALVVGATVATGTVSRRDLGFPGWRRSVAAALVGGALGLGVFTLQGPATTDPVVLVNVYAQVLPVSIAEVTVCWVVVGGTVAAVIRRSGGSDTVARVASLGVASVCFGAYHFAHSPPFDTLEMVVLLTVVGVATSVVYAASGSVYGALAFHNALALYGVVASLAASERLASYGRPVVPVLVTGVVALAVFVATERLVVRDDAP
ncbi:type II CAAX prenyl endopeptidase Rce1 family protein [Halobaculum marinum]|uniref:Type II CAAX prenyl endopeptidase Rce1 family protein n=1 Tax=Halobaculum marinum TaxID=3031996 RepID=A0ABD5WWW4_9EURY|nr:CPBP family glutamic-type intramembrane protease [Halobaculum sp. DT55]